MADKPVVEGPVNGNVFAVVAAAKKALRKAGMVAQAEECETRCLSAGSYDQVLAIVQEYVEFSL